jgi:hypothetical protein
MFRVEEVSGPRGVGVKALLAHFTNPFNAFHLLGRAFWCGCEFIAFTMYNIFSNFDYIFPTPYHMHTLPYFVDEGQAAARGDQHVADRGGQHAATNRREEGGSCEDGVGRAKCSLLVHVVLGYR